MERNPISSELLPSIRSTLVSAPSPPTPPRETDEISPLSIREEERKMLQSISEEKQQDRSGPQIDLVRTISDEVTQGTDSDHDDLPQSRPELIRVIREEKSQDLRSENNSSRTQPETLVCIFCWNAIEPRHFSARQVMRCPGEFTVDHKGFVFGHIQGAMAGADPSTEPAAQDSPCASGTECGTCRTPMTAEHIVTDNVAVTAPKETWGQSILCDGWLENSGVRQPNRNTCYAAALATAMRGLGISGPEATVAALVHRFAYSPIAPHSEVGEEALAYRAAYEALAYRMPDGTFHQVLATVGEGTNAQKKAIEYMMELSWGIPVGSAAPGLGAFPVTLKQAGTSGEAVVDVISRGGAYMGASSAHWHVAYGYQRSTRGAYRALVYDPETNAYTIKSLPGIWHDGDAYSVFK
ncbi:hypothetical protein [Streptomyces sp. NPDC047028]|uniref:hypothetical protein n=1 Tax=Streptomyces sp. NPDC047028 TaxID=3155793 RepID=UPI0033EC85E2